MLSGTLRVELYHDDVADVTVLTAGQITDVPPGVLHRFHALTEVLAMEIYWVQLRVDDIERTDQLGGIDAGHATLLDRPHEPARDRHDIRYNQ